MTEKCIWPINFLTLNCKPANITSDGLLVVKSWGNIQKIILFCKQRGCILQLRGPYFTKFWPPTPLEWTFVEILHFYPLYVWLYIDMLFLLTTYLAFLVRVVMYWMIIQNYNFDIMIYHWKSNKSFINIFHHFFTFWPLFGSEYRYS